MVEKTILLQAENIRKTFVKDRSKVNVLNGISLTIHQGEMVALTGPSGAGKSTLLHILGTLERPDSGAIYFGNNRVTPLLMTDAVLSRFRNKFLGFIFQFHHLLPEFTALENVLVPTQIAGLNQGEAKKRAENLLDFVGLSHRLNHRPVELSGGEQQRVAIARAVIMEPKLLLADEITGNLDLENGKKIIELLKELNTKKGISLILATHDLGIAGQMHRWFQMKDGAIVS